MNSKKAQSEIITTVLIILLVLAAIIIVWQVVQSTIGGTSAGINHNKLCLGSQLTIVKAIANTSTSSGNVTITREASSGNDDNVTARLYVNNEQSPADSKPLAVYGRVVMTVNLTVGDDVKVAPVLSDNFLCTASPSVKATAS